MDQRIIDLYDEYTHAPLDRRRFIERLSVLVGGTAAAYALLPVLENNYAQAAVIAPDDARITTAVGGYSGPHGAVKTYEAEPKGAAATTPVVLVIHENRGLNPHIEDIARRLAVAGFHAVALDLLSHDGGTPADEDKARDMIGKLNAATVNDDVVAAITTYGAKAKVGLIGFCWGGGVVGQVATLAPTLAAGVVYYGMPPALDAVAKIKAPLLLHYAGEDKRILDQVPAFLAALQKAGVPHENYTYAGAQHAFNNDTNAARYDKKAADLSWERSLAFLKKALG